MAKGFLTKLGLVTDDQPQAAAYKAPTPQYTTPTPAPVLQSGSADPEMVKKLKTLVLGASPIIGQFMQNLDIARPQFPNDETACMRAALAFTRVEKSVLIEELNRTVSAALTHAKNSMDTDRKKAREAAVGGLDKDLSDTTTTIKNMEGQIVDLQQSIAAKRTELTQLQGKIQAAETDLRRQDDTVNASFSQIEQYIALLGQTFTKL